MMVGPGLCDLDVKPRQIAGLSFARSLPQSFTRVSPIAILQNVIADCRAALFLWR